MANSLAVERAGFVSRAREELQCRGWAQIPPCDDTCSGPDRILQFAARFGIPSTRDGGRAVWPVRALAGRDATFSLRAGKAGMHTDSAYHRVPEPLFLLHCVRAADDGGDSLLVHIDDVVAEICAKPEGAAVLRTLREPLWRWRPPAEYSAVGSTPAAPIIAGTTVRWRGDNLVIPQGETYMQAVRVFDMAAELAALSVRFRLRPGWTLIVDNLRVMHGRTPFSDRRRLLLRVRLWPRKP